MSKTIYVDLELVTRLHVPSQLIASAYLVVVVS